MSMDGGEIGERRHGEHTEEGLAILDLGFRGTGTGVIRSTVLRLYV